MRLVLGVNFIAVLINLGHHDLCLVALPRVVSEEERRRDLRDRFTSACPAGCEHLADTV